MNANERRSPLADVLAATTDTVIPTIDLLTIYEQAHNDGIFIYQLDDSHWNTRGLELAVSALVEIIGKNTIAQN